MTPRLAPHAARSYSHGVRLGLLPLAAALLLGGCSSADPDEPARAAASSAPSASPAPSAGATVTPTPTPTPTAAAPAAPAVTITMVGFDYEIPASVPAGSQVTVVNEDAEAHTLTLPGERLVVPPRGARATFTAPAEPGTYRVVCEFHGGMEASLVVA